MGQRNYTVYIMSNAHHTVFYVGVTNNLPRRVHEHRLGIGSKFTKKYQIKKLVYCEFCRDVSAAIAREKQLKAGSRKDKIALIEASNPNWIDLLP